jgi:SAM-dependent methyltransferase
MKCFVEKHLDKKSELKILDLGSQIVDKSHKSYKSLCAENWHYDGCDIESGTNVNVVMSGPYTIPKPDDYYDVIISGQAFEHIEFFWMTFLELARILKPGGLMCVIAPGTGPVHNCPIDCWRYHPDGMKAICKWINFELIDADMNLGNYWWDCTLIMKKPEIWAQTYKVIQQ